MKLLIVDDDRVTRDLLGEIFSSQGYEFSLVSSGEDALQRLRDERFSIVLSDVHMLEVDGYDLLAQCKRLPNPPIVILMTAFGTMEGAIRAIQDGAFDYVSKPFKVNELKAVVHRAARQVESQADGTPVVESSSTPMLTPRSLIGKSPALVEVFKTMARATLASSPVLIFGESGTGKELVARAIHEHSERRRKKFIPVNCGALAENLLESELFGHVRGAFTGAVGNKVGLFEEADHGTLFLDEIGDMTPALQVKLLRTLQEGEFKPVGSQDTKKADVRIVAATHRNLEEAVQKGQFREDLYYRLKVIRIDLPPLRERREDLADLVRHFLLVYSVKLHKRITHVASEAMSLLEAYSWPGNVRELEHAIERAVTMARSSQLYPDDFPPEIQGEPLATPVLETAQVSLEEVERRHILKVLEDAKYNKSKAAQILGIDRKTLHRKAQKYGIVLPEK